MSKETGKAVKIDEETYNILKKMKVEKGTSMSWYIKKAVEEKLKHDKK